MLSCSSNTRTQRGAGPNVAQSGYYWAAQGRGDEAPASPASQTQWRVERRRRRDGTNLKGRSLLLVLPTTMAHPDEISLPVNFGREQQAGGEVEGISTSS